MLRICPLAPDRSARDSNRKVRSHPSICRDGRVLRGSSDQQAAIAASFDIRREPGYVDQRIRSLDRLTHQVDEVGAAAEILGTGGGAR
jgi:hypothetical protein